MNILNNHPKLKMSLKQFKVITLYNEKDGNREEIIRNRVNYITTPVQETEQSARRKRRPPTRNDDFLWE
jgi:hypothetical protein